MRIREFILSYEDHAPVLFNWLRYLHHVSLKGNIVYPSVTKKIFKRVDGNPPILNNSAK